MKSTAFIHVPKTGGTTLDYIFKSTLDFFSPDAKRTVQLVSEPSSDYYRSVASGSNFYVSGHFPLSTIDPTSFQRTVTIIRDPVALVASIYSFCRENDFLSSSIGLQEIFSLGLYQVYFSVSFDLQRFCIEKDFGAIHSFNEYIDTTTPEKSFSELSEINRIIDFNNFDSDVKRLVIEDQLYPFNSLPKSRSYGYNKIQALDNSRHLVSNFDIIFYEIFNKNKVSYATVSDSEYGEYRLNFAKKYGLVLPINSEMLYDLKKPIGVGWYDLELSEISNPFRWSEPIGSVEIPFAFSGSYIIRIYYLQPNGETVNFTPIFNPEGKTNKSESIVCGHVSVYNLEMSILSPGWLTLEFDIDSYVAKSTHDYRDLGMNVSAIYIKRIIDSGSAS